MATQPQNGTAGNEPQPAIDLVKLPAVHDENLRDEEHLPSPYQVIEDLGIPDWKILEKKIVRRLDMTLLP
jgi:hypothetical protein